MGFDPRPEACPLFKERVLWTIVTGLLFFLVYGITNQISALSAPHPSFFARWEQQIPFVPEMIVPYMSSDVLFVVAFLIVPTRGELQKLAMRVGLAILVSAAFFLVVPLQFSFELPAVEGWPRPLFRALSLDKPYNQFPSLHISLGAIVWQAIAARTRGVLAVGLGAWFLLIGASTLLVYQHHAIDLLGGALVVVLVFHLVPAQATPRVPLSFVSPRHLGMALRYLVVATVATVLALRGGPPAPVLGWIAICFFCLSASYTLGLNRFVAKPAGRYAVWSRLLYGPYLAACWLNWRFWKNRVPLMVEVAPGVWLGARPCRADLERISAAGIRTVIDLAPELSSSIAGNFAYRHEPLLDLAIPDPQRLAKVVQAIEEARASGAVYVHCALGMSRSVMAVGAWLMTEGWTPEQVLVMLDQARPERVRRPYIEITLEVYRRQLEADEYSTAAAVRPFIPRADTRPAPRARASDPRATT